MVRTSTLPDDDTKGNEADGRDPGQAYYDDKFNHRTKAEELADLEGSWNEPYKGKNGQYVDAHGDTVQTNFNADAPDISSREKNPDAIPRVNVGGGSSEEEEDVKGGSRWRSRLRNAKRYGATGGAAGVLVGGFFGISIIMVPGSLLVTIEKAITNDSADSARTNITFRRAYVSKLFNKGSEKKSGSKIEDELTKMSPEQEARWKEAGFDIQLDENGKIDKMTFPDGTPVDNGEAFNNHAENTPTGRDAAANVLDTRSAFFDNQEFKDLLDRFKIEKSNRIKSSTDEDPEKRKAAIDKSFDDNTKINEQSGSDTKAIEARQKSLTDDTVGDGGSKVKGAVDKIRNSISEKAGAAGVLTAPVSAACATYNVAKLTNATIKAKWIYDLISFAYPFVRAAAQIEDQGDIEPEVVDNLASRLTWFDPSPTVSQAQADADPFGQLKVGQPNPQYNKTAMDSQGLQMALYGDLTGLTNFSKKYTSWGWETAPAVVDSVAVSYLNIAKSLLGGKDGVKDVCRGAKAVQTAAIVACVNNPAAALICGITAFAAPIAEHFLLPIMVAQLAKPALHVLATVDLSSALEGEGAGDAIAAGIGLLLSGQSLGSGLIPAGGKDALPNIYKFIADTNDAYYNNTTQLALDEAKKDPFDVTNQYSFTGQIASMLNPYLNGDGTIFSRIANMTHAMGSSFATIPMTANALFSQPSNMTLLDGLSKDPAGNRIAKCQDSDMADIDAVCDWSGRIVGYTSDTVIQGLNSIANNTAPAGSDILSQSIQYLTAGKKDQRDIDPDTGKIRDGSDFDNYVKYCVTRKGSDGGLMPIGSSTAPITDDNYDWTDGSKCMPKTADDSKMLDNFATYYNWCYIQYATAERVNNCVDKTPETDAAASSTAPTGNIAQVAQEMGAWGGQYQACYTMGGGHGDLADLQRRIAAHFAGPENGVDCSGFTRAVIYQATGTDPGAMSTSEMCARTDVYEHIPRAQAQPGDLAIDCPDHVEVITSVNGGKFATVGSHTTGCGPGMGPSPSDYQGTEDFVLRYKGGAVSV